MRNSPGLLAPLLLGLCACGGSSETNREQPSGTWEQEGAEIIYGADGRQEIASSTPDALWQAEIAGAVLAITREELLEASRSLEQTEMLCAGHALAEQPSVVTCTGVLIAPDILLTAGHCFSDEADCQSALFLAGYYYDSSGVLAAVEQDQRYSCRALLAHRNSYVDGTRDWAIVRLDRPVVGSHPLALAELPPSPGDSLWFFGFPLGVPMKSDPDVTVLQTDAGQRWFTVAADTAAGGSGAPLVDSEGQLLGVLTRGETDLELTAAGCFRERRLDPECADCEDGGELAVLARVPLDAFCRSPGAGAPCAQPTPARDNSGAGCAVGPWHSPGGGPRWLGGCLLMLCRRWRGRRATQRGCRVPRIG